MKKKFLRAVLSATLAATLCFASAMSALATLPVERAAEETAPRAAVDTSATTEMPDAQIDLPNDAMSQVNAQLEDMQNQVKKATVEATLAVAFGFAALVLGVVALLMGLRKTASANNGIRSSSDNNADWKKLNQSIQQMEGQLQKLAQKQEKALEAARTYTPEPTVPVQSAVFAEQAVHQPSPKMGQPSVMERSPAAKQPPVQGPMVLGYLVYEKNYRGEMAPTVKKLPGEGKIQMKILSDRTVVVDEELLKDHYETAQHLIDAGLDRVFDITVAGRAYKSQMLRVLGALKLKKIQRAAQVELAPDGVKVIACGGLEFEQMDYS